MPPSLRLPTAAEQHLPSYLRVRPVTESERPRWNAEVAAHHYLQNATLVGEHLCDVTAESTYQRALAALDHDRFEPLLLRWQHAQLGPVPDDHIALDGKRLRRSGGLAIASAVGLPSQRVHSTVAMGPHDSELVAVRQLLAKTEFTDLLLALDARHTQHETIPQILYGHGADYLVPLKDNQATMLATAQTLLPESPSPFARRSSTRSIAAAARGRNAVAPGSNTGALSATSRPLNWAGPGRRN